MKLRVKMIRTLEYDDVVEDVDGDTLTGREAAEADMNAIMSGEWDIVEFMDETDTEENQTDVICEIVED
jgi:hypothetical protein